MAVSLRMPESVKKRVAKLAQERATTPHAFMLEAIQDKVEFEERKAAFHAEALRRLAKMKRSGKGIPAGEVFDYLRDRAVGKRPRRPSPRKTP